MQLVKTYDRHRVAWDLSVAVPELDTSRGGKRGSHRSRLRPKVLAADTGGVRLPPSQGPSLPVSGAKRDRLHDGDLSVSLMLWPTVRMRSPAIRVKKV